MTFEYSDYFTVGDFSSGPIHLRFTTNVGVTKSDVSAIYHFKDSANKDVSGIMNTDMVISNKMIDISCNLSEISILNKLKTSTSDISFTFKKTVDNSDLSTVVLKRSNLYNLPSSVQVNTTGLQSTSGNGRFGITTPNKTPSGDIMQQTTDLSWNRNIVLDLCGSFTGFQSSDAANWITDISWSSKANPSVDQAADWHNNIKLDMSNVVMVGAGKSHVELSISAEHVFDISQLHIKANMKVPGGVEGPVTDASFVIDLSRSLANLPVLQKVLLSEYNPAASNNKKEIYNTPDIIYVKYDGANFKIYRDKAYKSTLTPLSFLVNRPYYFHYNTSGSLGLTGSPDRHNATSNLEEVIWKTPSLINIATNPPISNIPVIREISHNLNPTKKEHIKWVGKVGSDTSSVLSYQFQFSTLRPETEMKFHSTATLTAMDLSAHHMKVAGKDEVNVKRVAARVGSFEAVDISFVINVPADKDISLDHIFINSKIKGTSIPDVSSALLPPLVFPHENVYQIPDKYKTTKVANAWTGIITASKEDMSLRINDDYDATYMLRDIVQIFVKYNGASAPYYKYYTDEKMQHEVEYLEKERIYRFIYKGASASHRFFVSDSDGGALAAGFSIVNNPFKKSPTGNNGLEQHEYVDVLIENAYGASSMRGICSAHVGMVDTINVQAKSTNRTWFDVNQATNFVEISLNHILPSDVSASWFRQTLSDASYIQYSIDDGTTWKDVSYNKKDMIQSDKQTLAFSICGEVLTTHTLLLKQHFRLYDHEKTNQVRDISFVTDVTSHVMKQPVLKSMKVFDHKKLDYVDMKDVSYIINPRRLVLRSSATADLRAIHPDENGKTWAGLFDLSAVARYEFDKDGNKMGPHNNLTTHYDIDASMAYTIIGDRQYINQKDTHKIVGHNIVDICGVIQHEGSNLKDLSFSLMLKRKGANYFIDACGATQHLKLDVSKVWDIPCDLSWVGAFKTNGAGTTDGAIETKKFTNKKISSSISASTNSKKQIIRIDVSGGDFPTDASSDFIKAIKYSKFGSSLDKFYTSYADKQDQTYISDISLIKFVGTKYKGLQFQFDASAIGDGPNIWLNVILNGPGDNSYNLVYVLNDYVDAIEPPRDFNAIGVKISTTPLTTVSTKLTHQLLSEVKTSSNSVVALPSTSKGYFTTLEDMSCYLFCKAGERFNSATHAAGPSSFDVSYTYTYKTNTGQTLKIAKALPVINICNDALMPTPWIETKIRWIDISLGIPVDISFSMKADLGGGMRDLSARFQELHFSYYDPPTTVRKVYGDDVSTNIYTNAPTIATDESLKTKYSGKKLSFMASGEVDIFFTPGISFDMIPKSLWTNKDSIQSIVKSIDISYGTTRNAIGIYKHTKAHANNDISCIPSGFIAGIGNDGAKGTPGVRFNFDASHNAAALSRFKPHLPPSDMSINIVYYTNLAQTETSMITWDVPRSQIDWLDPPKKATKYVARTESGNAQVTSGKDTSFSTVQDMSMTVVLDRKFHHFFPKRYANDTSAMIIDVSLAWTTNITGDGTTRNTKFIDVTKELKNAPTDASYISFKVKWEDLSKGVPIASDPSSIQMRMRIHQKRDAGHATRLSTDVSLLTFDISSQSIKMYEAPNQVKFNNSKNKLHSVLTSTSSTPLTGDFSMSTWLDTSVNLTFPKDAFGHIYDKPDGVNPRVARTPTDVKKLVQNVRYDFIHKGDKAISINDCSFIRTATNDIIQVKLKGDDLSKGVINSYDPSAMRFTLQTFRDRAATSDLSHTMFVDVSVSDISYYLAPTSIDKVFSQHATTGGAKTAGLDLAIADISFDISLSFPNNLKFPDRDTSKWIQSIKFLWGSNGQEIKTLPTNKYSISSDLVTINTNVTSILQPGSKPTPNRFDVSVNVYLDRAKDASMNIAKNIPISTANTPTAFASVLTNTKGTKRRGFSIFGGDPDTNMTTDISFEVKTNKSFPKSETQAHIQGNKIQFQWLGGSWIDIATSTISHEIDVLKFAIPPRYFQSGDISLNKGATVFDISLHFSETPQNAADGGPQPPYLHRTFNIGGPDIRPKVQDISHYEYPADKHVGDVSCVVADSLVTTHKISAWTSVTNQDISINVNISGGREFIYGTKHGKAWTPSDFIKDMSLNWRPQFGAHKEISLKSEIPHMCLKDASTVQFKIGKHDLSAGYMGSTGRLDISMTVYQDISKTVFEETNTSTGGVYPNVQASDISYYKPPTLIKPAGIKSSLITHNKNNPVYFTDCSLSLWQDTSMTIELDNAFYTDVSKNVVVDLSYQLNWLHAPAVPALLNKSVKATIDICSNNTKLLTFKLDGSDLSAGVPHTRTETKATGTSDFSLNLHIYRDLAKTKGSNVDHIISTALRSKDISYYHAPYYEYPKYKNNMWLMDVSSVIKGGARHGQQIAGKLITSQADSTVTMTICGEMPYGTFFPTDVSSDWIKDVSLNWKLVDQTNFRPSTAIYKPSIKIQAKPGQSKLNQIVFDLCNDIIQNKIAHSAQFFATIYVDRSKTTTIDISSKLILGTQSDPYIEQPVKPTTIQLVTDVCNTSQLPGLFKTPWDTSVNLMIANPTKRIMSVKLTLDNPILQDTNAVVVKYRWKPYDATKWYDLGITNNATTITDTSVNYDFSLDPAPILWAVKNQGILGTKDPGSRGDEDILDFSMSFRYPDGNYIDVSTSVTTRSIDADHINTFKVPTNVKDTSFAYIEPVAAGIKTDVAILKKPFSRVKDVSVNLQLSRKGTGAVSNWNTPLLFEDVSYHVKSVSWKWVPNDGKPIKTKTILSSDSANWKKYVAPKFVTKHGDISGIEVLIEAKDISAGVTGSLTVSAEFYTDLSYSPAGYTRDVSYISKVIDQANIVQYKVPSSIRSDISSSLAENDTIGNSAKKQIADFSFSHLFEADMSVNLGFTFGNNEDFYQQYKGSTVTVEDLILDASYSWNDTKYSVSVATDLSFISSDKIQMRVKKEHFKEYPTKPMKFTVRFFKDIAKTTNYYHTTEGTIELKNIEKYKPPSIVKLQAYRPDGSTHYTDCSISLLNPKYPSAIRNSFYWARLRVEFDSKDILKRYNYHFANSNDPSLSMPITYSFYNADSKMHEKQIGLSGDDLHPGAAGLYQVKTIDRYKLGISSEDINTSPTKSKFMDFSINIQPILMGLSNKDFVDATASQQDKTGIKLWFKPYKHRINDVSTGLAAPFTVANGNDIFDSDLSLIIPFKDISYYDGRALVNTFNNANDTVTNHLLVKSNTGTAWKGAAITAGKLLDINQDCSMQLHFKFHHGSRFGFYNKDTTRGPLDFSMVVKDICFGYTGNAWRSLKVDGASKYYDTENKFIDASSVQFVVPKYVGGKVDYDVSVVVHFNRDLCGNNQFTVGTHAVSFLIPKDKVVSFDGPKSLSYEKGMDMKTPGGEFISRPAQLNSYYSRYRHQRNDKFALSMREDTSLSIIFETMAAGQPAFGTYNGNPIFTTSHNILINDVSFSWNNGSGGSAYPIWQKIPTGDISNTMTKTARGDMMTYIKIPKIPDVSKSEFPGAFGEFVLSLYARKTTFSGAPSPVTLGDCKPFTLKISSNNIISNPLVIKLDDNTIVGNKASKQLIGWNTSLSKYTNRVQEAIGISFDKTTASNNFGLSYEEVSGKKYIIRNKHGKRSSANPYSLLLNGDGGSSHKVGKALIGPKIQTIVYAGRSTNSAFVSFGGSSFAQLGNVINTTKHVSTSNYRANGHNPVHIFINGQLVTRASDLANYQVSEISPFNYGLTDTGNTGNSDIVMGATNLNLDMEHALRIGTVNDNGTAGAGTPTANEIGRIYAIHLYDASMTPQDLSLACLEMAKYMENVKKPTLELTKNSNIDWKSIGKGMVGITAKTPVMFDISSDTSMNLTHYMNYSNDSNSPFVTIKAKRNNVDTSYALFPKSYTSSQISQIKAAYPSAKTAKDLSFSLYNMVPDMSKNTKRFTMVLEKDSVVGDAFVGDISCIDISMHNFKTRENVVISEQLIKQFTAPKMTELKTTLKYSGHDYNDPVILYSRSFSPVVSASDVVDSTTAYRYTINGTNTEPVGSTFTIIVAVKLKNTYTIATSSPWKLTTVTYANRNSTCLINMSASSRGITMFQNNKSHTLRFDTNAVRSTTSILPVSNEWTWHVLVVSGGKYYSYDGKLNAGKTAVPLTAALNGETVWNSLASNFSTLRMTGFFNSEGGNTGFGAWDVMDFMQFNTALSKADAEKYCFAPPSSSSVSALRHHFFSPTKPLGDIGAAAQATPRTLVRSKASYSA